MTSDLPSRYHHFKSHPEARSRFDREFTADRSHPLHDDARASHIEIDLLMFPAPFERQAASIVVDRQREVAVLGCHVHDCSLGPAVPAHVGESLLRDAHQLAACPR